MSTNFTGVTFAQQKVLPSDDAIIRRAILPDGILYGCELSYSGSTLTMAAGQLLICGRQIRHPAAQNWAVVDATSGFARLLLTVDLTRTSTKEVFEQVVDSIEYAASEDGFPNLVQEDTNVSGSRYQVTACVVSLGPGGITGIVSQLRQSGALSMELLWENASPESEFAAQRIALEQLGQYSAIAVEHKGGIFWTSTQGTTRTISSVNAYVSDTYYIYLYSRAFTSGNNYLEFYDAFNISIKKTGETSWNVHNTLFIPLKIYGVKGVSA